MKLPENRIRDSQVKIYVTFFAGDEDVEGLAKTLPPSPYDICNKAGRSTEKALPRTSLVVYASESEAWDGTLEEHWHFLARKFTGYEQHLKNLEKLSKRVLVTIVTDLSDGAPTIFLPRNMVDFLSKIGAEVEIDILLDRD